MARIEWSALGGGEVETVISMLMYNEYPHARRIRPSRGDYGVDILVPRDTEPPSTDVWQIKKFANNLTSTQKQNIEKSFQRALIGSIRRGIQLADWYLVMPLDPTIENSFDWFNAMPDRVIEQTFADVKLALTDEEKDLIRTWRSTPGRIIDWRGLTYCETLAAKFWFVPDYYLHGGSERIKSAVAEIAKILQRDTTLSKDDTITESPSILEPGELREHLTRLGHALDGDPHFRYGVSIDPSVPQLSPEPGLIAAAQEVAPDGMCLTFRIYARFDEAINERPIPIKLRFQFKADTPEQQAFDEWRKYGKELTATVGVDSGLPGGLGGSFEGSVATISPIDGRKRVTRYRVVTPDGDVISELQFSSVSTTGFDGTGLHAKERDTSGFVSIEVHFDMTDNLGKVEFKFNNPTGHEAIDVATAVEFVAGLTKPNRLEIAGKHGPFHPLRRIVDEEPPIPQFVAKYITALATLQQATTTPIVIPDLTTVTGDLAQQVLMAAKLVEGQTIIGTWKPFEFEVDESSTIKNGGHYQISTIEPLTVAIGEKKFTFGATENILLSATLTELDNGRTRAEPRLNDVGHRIFAPDEPLPLTDHLPVRSRPAPER